MCNAGGDTENDGSVVFFADFVSKLEKVLAFLTVGRVKNRCVGCACTSKTRVAQNMLGKKVGDDFELPDEEGNLTFATVKEIRPLTDEIRAWMKLPDGIQI